MKNRDSPIVYICSPYSGDVYHNTEMARRYSRYATDKGCAAIAPHLLLPQYISEEKERDLAISIDLRFIDICTELWVCGSRISAGMKQEMEYAESIGKPIRRITEDEIYVCSKVGQQAHQ